MRTTGFSVSTTSETRQRPLGDTRKSTCYSVSTTNIQGEADKSNQVLARVEKREMSELAGARRHEMSVQSVSSPEQSGSCQDAEKKLKSAERSVLSWVASRDLTFEQRSVAQVLLWSETPQPSNDPVTPAELHICDRVHTGRLCW